MKRTQVAATGHERVFGREEVIVSKTDTRGVIQYANDVFLRVSAYTEAEVVGQPHSMIRHPEMPRGLFHLLWQTISAGQELFAYINNLAGDGAHYWVLAHVTPSFGSDGSVVGYHSNRRLPEPSAIAAIKPVYAQLRAEESRHRNAREAATASARLLCDLVAGQGKTYDQYVWDLTNRSLAGTR